MCLCAMRRFKCEIKWKAIADLLKNRRKTTRKWFNKRMQECFAGFMKSSRILQQHEPGFFGIVKAHDLTSATLKAPSIYQINRQLCIIWLNLFTPINMRGNDSTYVCKPHMEIELWPHPKLFLIYSSTRTLAKPNM